MFGGFKRICYFCGILITKAKKMMKQLKLSLRLMTIVTLCVFCWSTCPAKANTNIGNSSIVQDDPVKVRACLIFLENFYKGLKESGLDANYVQQFVTPNAKQFLQDSYDYDCPEGQECMATWLFCYNTTADVMNEQELKFEVVDENTYVAMTIYTDTAHGDYVYAVKLGLIKDGDTFKIDTIEEVINCFPDEDIAQ